MELNDILDERWSLEGRFTASSVKIFTDVSEALRSKWLVDICQSTRPIRTGSSSLPLCEQNILPVIYLFQRSVETVSSQCTCFPANIGFTRDLELDCVWNVMAHAQKPDFVFGETDESI